MPPRRQRGRPQAAPRKNSGSPVTVTAAKVTRAGDSGSAVERIREALEQHDCRPYGSNVRLRARCPAHGSRGPTLSVSQGRAGALVHCFAQCDTADVLAAIGLAPGDLFDEPPARRAGWVPRPRRPEPTPAQQAARALVRAVGIGLLRDAMLEAGPLGPSLSWQDRLELAEWGSEQDARAHFWRTMARYAALACDEDYVRKAYATPRRERCQEQVAVLLTRREDLERRGGAP